MNRIAFVPFGCLYVPSQGLSILFLYQSVTLQWSVCKIAVSMMVLDDFSIPKSPFSSLHKFVYQAIIRKPLFSKLLQKAQLFNLYIISISSQPGTSLKAKTDIGPDKKWLGWHGGMGWRDTNSNQDDLALITTSDSNQSFFSQSLQVITHTLTKYFSGFKFIVDFFRNVFQIRRIIGKFHISFCHE